MRNRLIPALLVALTAHCRTDVISAENWGQFRGTNASGVSQHSTNPPLEFSAEKNVAWSVDLGPGVACPVIAEGRVFATATIPGPAGSNEGEFVVSAFDAASGEQLWQRTFPTGRLPDITPPNEHASSTPATDGRTVFVHFTTLGLLALDATTGELQWKHSLTMPFYLMSWGAANSPIIYQDLVIFNLDDDLSPYLIAFEKDSGSIRWKTPRPEMLGGYAVPVLCTAGGRTDIVVAGTGKMKGYDPESGREVWTCNTLLRTVMTSPVVVNDHIYFSCQSVGDTERVLKFALLDWRDTNQDKKLEKSELDPAFHEKFDRGDANADGFLIDDEIDVAFQAPGNMVGGGNVIQAIRGGGTGDVTATHLSWNLDSTQAPSNIASPLAVDDRLFLVKAGGISAAFSLKDGSTLWTKKRIGNLGNHYASPITAGGYVYVPGENGNIVVLRLGTAPEVIGKNDIGDSVIATPAIADNRLYVRTLRKLYCFSEGGK